MKLRTPLLILVAVALLLPTVLFAQWTDDPAVNLLISGGSGEQVVPHTVSLGIEGDFAGFTYVGFYNNASGNYDVALQLLTPEGIPVFAEGGMIVSAQAQNTWVMDWALAVDDMGNALVSFADIRDGNSNIHIYKISPSGEFLWGADGISLTANSNYKGPPAVTVAGDGDVVVAWYESAASEAIFMQRLSGEGELRFADGGIITTQPDDSFPAGNVLVPTGAADVILGYVPSYSFMGNRQIKAQRFDAMGASVWADYLWVMDDASIPMGRYFSMAADGFGGVLFNWDVTVGNSFGARVQRVTADGMELMPHNGAFANASGATGQIGGSAVIDPATEITTLVYTQMNPDQNLKGLFVQRFDAAGNRLLGSGGNELHPQDSISETRVQLVLTSMGVMGAYFVADYNQYASDQVKAFLLDDAGEFAFDVFAASNPSSKDDPVVALSTNQIITYWVDERNGTYDMYGQNINFDGTLGEQVVGIDNPGEMEEQAELPGRFQALGNYPNPFNPATTIRFDLPRASQVSLRIYDVSGKLVRELVNANLPAAEHQVVWNGTDDNGRLQPSGVYHYRVISDMGVVTRTMTLIK